MSDAAIPLSVRPPQIANPVDEYGKLLSIRRMQRQGEQQDQMFPEQLKSAQLENQQREQANKDQEIFAKAYRDSQGDITKFPSLAAQYGMSGKGISDMNTHLATIRHQLATSEEVDHKNEAFVHDEARGRLDSFRNSKSDDDEAKARNWPTLINQMVVDKILKSTEAQDWLRRFPMKQWDPSAAQDLSNSLMTGSQLNKEADAAKRTAATTAASQARSDKDNLTTAARTVPDDPDGYAKWYAELDDRTRPRMPAQYSPANVKIVRGMGGTPDQNVKAALTQSQLDDKQFQQAGSTIGQAQTAAEATQLIDQQPHGIAKRLPAVPNEQDFDPKEWRKSVDNALSSPPQRVTAGNAETREKDAETNRQFNRDMKTGKNGAMTPGQSAVQGRHLDAEKDRHDEMQKQEQDWWGLHTRFGRLADPQQTPDGSTFLYPTTTTDKSGNLKVKVVEQQMTPQWRQQVQDDYQKAEGTAKQLSQKQKDLRQRYGWGEFKQGSQQAQPPAASQFKVGTPVMHKGKPAHVVGYDANNKPMIVYDTN